MDFESLAKDQSQEQIAQIARTLANITCAYLDQLEKNGLGRKLCETLTEDFNRMYIAKMLGVQHG